MKIQLIESVDFNQNLVIICKEKSKILSDFPEEIKTKVKLFLKDESDFDYLKYANQMIFLIKPNSNLEKLRIKGFNVRSLFDKKEKYITIIGEQTDHIDAFTEGFLLSNYQFLKYFKDKEKKEFKLEYIHIYGKFSKTEIEKLKATVDIVFWTRNLVNEPVSYLTASKLSEEIVKKAERTNLKVTIFEKNQIESLKMGGLLAVNKGSIEPPTFTIIEYKPKKAKNQKPIVLVGKGVVYDTGGLSLKPTAGSMDLMKSDMAGAACVAGTMMLIEQLKIDLHVIALIPATDNRPGMNAYTPGDVINMFDGTTVEVLNTDAEGRMILADALAYSKKFDPELVIDAATLTGAAVVAIGTKAACLMSNAKEKITSKLIKSGENVHERVVQLPFWEEYADEIKSSIADLKNIGGKYAGMITAGKFLEHFVKAPYVHLDIAGPAFLETPENYKGKGGTGFGVRLLTDFLANYKND